MSIFEPHTDIFVKDRRDTFYGHKIRLTSGASGLVLDVGSKRALRRTRHSRAGRWRAPRPCSGALRGRWSFDGGFSSEANAAEINAMGVADVAFSKDVGLAVTTMAKSPWVFRKLRNFRAGIEAGISFLERTFRLDRCNWSGVDSFGAYVWGSVLSCNVLVVARHLLATSNMPPRRPTSGRTQRSRPRSIRRRQMCMHHARTPRRRTSRARNHGSKIPRILGKFGLLG